MTERMGRKIGAASLPNVLEVLTKGLASINPAYCYTYPLADLSDEASGMAASAIGVLAKSEPWSIV
jgi:hypothetical protein